jgi:predicted MPP superfamily phosphohydrolase
MRLGKRLVIFIGIVQSILLLGHAILYLTWSFANPGNSGWTLATFAFLAFSFVGASLLAFRYTNAAVRVFYKAAAIWLGMLTFFISASVLAWVALPVAELAGLHVSFHRIVEVLFAMAAMTGALGLLNASCTRVTRATVELANLPEAWRGRRAALISDVHLGHVRNRSFLQRLVAKILKEEPHAVFIAGDLYDGTAIDAAHAAEPLSKLSAPHGVYFVAGNHEQFGDDSKYLRAVAAAGVRVLSNEKVEIDGLQIVGVPYRNATQARHLALALDNAGIDRGRASILLTHAPDHPHVAEAAGISLQLSGHTHRGQFIPWSWLARKVYRQFVYGLSRIGGLQVFTSSGAGTWGPPVRLGTRPEIVVLEFV